MEWYYGSADEDVTVPKHEQIFEGFPSSNNWPSWVNAVGNYNSQKKHNGGVEEFFSEPMYSRSASRQQSACEHSDDQLNDLPKIEAADDIFFNSIFKVDAEELEGSNKGSNSSGQTSTTTTWNDVMAIDFSNHIRDCTNDVSSTGEFPTEQDMEAEMCMLEEQSDMCDEDMSEYISMDEPVLLELQNLTQQLADTTRVCFRDSLYRLAENSRYQTRCSQNGKGNMEDCEPNTRVGPSRLQESETEEDSEAKSIDRTIATLLFTTMNSCNSTSTSGGEAHGKEYQTNSHWYHPCSPTPGDAEVPTFDLMSRSLRRTAF